MIQPEEIETRFTYHTPTGDQPERYTKIREMARVFAEQIVELTPESREQSLALTRLEGCVMWANAAIARREVPIPTEEPATDPEIG